MFVDDKETLLVFRFAHWTRNLERFSPAWGGSENIYKHNRWKIKFLKLLFFLHIAWNLSIAASVHPRYLCGLF